MKHLTLLLVVLALLAGAWLWREPSDARSALSRVATAWHVEPAAAAEPALAAPAGVRKCLRDGQALYTDGACPPGSVPHTLQADRLTVLPAAPRPAAASAPDPAGRLPHVRDLLVSPQDGQLKERMMERVINP